MLSGAPVLGAMDSEECNTTFAAGGTSPILRADFLAYPAQPCSSSRRARSRFKEFLEIIDLVNWAVLGLKELYEGVFSSRLLARQPPSGGHQVPSAPMPSSLMSRLFFRLRAFPPPPSRLRGEAAVTRLRGSGGERPPALVEADSLGCALPLRGDIYPASIPLIALPPAGSCPVPIVDLSPIAASYLQNVDAMLASQEEMEENLQKAPAQPFVDPNSTLRDLLQGSVEPHKQKGSPEQRIVKGAVTLTVSLEMPVHFAYIDDLGVIGLRVRLGPMSPATVL